MHAADQQALALFPFQKIECCLYARLPAGQDDNRVRWFIQHRRLHAGDLLAECDKADQKGDKGQKKHNGNRLKSSKYTH
ncbi:hypothetical protein D9M72_648620 [compost metagenome]